MGEAPLSPPGAAGGSGPPELLQAYVERRDSLVRLFAARLRSVAAAEDLVQDIFLKISSLPPDTAIDNPASYLFRTGTNLMLDRRRGEQRSLARDSAWRDTTHAAVGGQDVVDEPDAEAVVAARQRLKELAAAIDELPPRMQRAFRLHKLDGLSQAETARAMGVSVGSVEKHIAAAMRTLSGRLG